MDCNEFYVDVRKTSPEKRKEVQRQTQLLFKINHKLPFSCKPVLIKEYAWIGAGATILLEVCIGKHAIV